MFTLQVTLNLVEVREVTKYLVTSLGREWDVKDFHQLATVISTFTFPVFLTFLEGRYAQDTEAPALERAVRDLYRHFVEQILNYVSPSLLLDDYIKYLLYDCIVFKKL